MSLFALKIQRKSISKGSIQRGNITPGEPAVFMQTRAASTGQINLSLLKRLVFRSVVGFLNMEEDWWVSWWHSPLWVSASHPQLGTTPLQICCPLILCLHFGGLSNNHLIWLSPWFIGYMDLQSITQISHFHDRIFGVHLFAVYQH